MVQSAMDRQRAESMEGVPTDLIADYYSSRTGFGLIITGGSAVSEIGNAAPMSCPIYSQAQTEGWA